VVGTSITQPTTSRSLPPMSLATLADDEVSSDAGRRRGRHPTLADAACSWPTMRAQPLTLDDGEGAVARLPKGHVYPRFFVRG
jgi:hypothetical protein